METFAWSRAVAAYAVRTSFEVELMETLSYHNLVDHEIVRTSFEVELMETFISRFSSL